MRQCIYKISIEVVYLSINSRTFYILVDAKCPDDHPYAYLNGDYCCKEWHEDNIKQLGEGCDGSLISLSSVCCKTKTKCPFDLKCKNSDSLNIKGT